MAPSNPRFPPAFAVRSKVSGQISPLTPVFPHVKDATLDIRKRIVTDEDAQPVVVLVDYADWLEIERQLEVTSPSSPNSAADMTNGEFKTLTEEISGHWEGGGGLEYQRRIRAEWDRRWGDGDE